MDILRSGLSGIKRPSSDEWLVLRLFLFLSLGFGTLCVLGPGLMLYMALGMGVSKVIFPWAVVLSSYPVVFTVLSYILLYVSVHLLLGVAIWLLFLPIARRFADKRDILLLRGIALFCIFVFWIILIHSKFFPNSLTAIGNSSPVLDWLFAVASAVVAITVGFGCFTVIRTFQRRRLSLAVTACVTIGAVAIYAGGIKPVNPASGEGRELPNIIIIGIDSLRPDHLQRFGFPEIVMPNLEALLKNAALFERASTPLARTYPSWLTLLTGLEPQRHGGRFNLMPPDMVKSERSIAHIFKRRGYRTIYATDESRFSNIDRRYGFDEILAPPYGFLDFLLGSLNDAPLTNLLVNSNIGRALLPLSHANRAAYKTYWPETFDAELYRLIGRDNNSQPLFLAVHFALSHWPYRWGSNPQIKFSGYQTGTMSDNYRLYLNALHRVDRQLGDLMAQMKAGGRLENTLVLFTSDHGESFMLERDRLNGIEQGRDHQLPQIPGHATSVVDPSQYSVMMAFRDFGRNDVVGKTFATPVSLADVAPTLLSYTFGQEENDFDGLSLAAVIRGEIPPPEDRIFSRESGFTLAAILQNNPNSIDVFRQGTQYYNLNRSNGRLELKKELLDELMQTKQRAVVMGRWSLALIPTEDRTDQLILVDSESMRYWRESAFGDLNGPTALLTRALCLHYRGDAAYLPESLCHIKRPTEQASHPAPLF